MSEAESRLLGYMESYACLSTRFRAAEQALQAFVVPVTSAHRVRGYVSMRVSVEALDAARAVLRPPTPEGGERAGE